MQQTKQSAQVINVTNTKQSAQVINVTNTRQCGQIIYVTNTKQSAQIIIVRNSLSCDEPQNSLNARHKKRTLLLVGYKHTVFV